MGGIMVVGVLLIVGSGGLAFNRAAQRNRAFNLLIERGLNKEEARAHMAMTAQRTKLSIFSKAADYAGLDLGEVIPEEQRVAAEKEAEMEAIYGPPTPLTRTQALHRQPMRNRPCPRPVNKPPLRLRLCCPMMNPA